MTLRDESTVSSLPPEFSVVVLLAPFFPLPPLSTCDKEPFWHLFVQDVVVHRLTPAVDTNVYFKLTSNRYGQVKESGDV